MTGGSPSPRAVQREVRWPRIWLAVAIAFVSAWLGRLLPFAEGVDPGPACRLLFVTALTTSCWLLAAMPIAAASMLPLALLPILGVESTGELTKGYGHPILWLFGGGFVLPCATGIMLNTVEDQLRTTANSIANIWYNLLGFLPAPYVYGMIADSGDGDNKTAAAV